MARGADESSGDGRDNREGAQEGDHPQPSQAGKDEVGPVLDRHTPDAVESSLGGAGDSQAGEKRADEPDGQRRVAAFEAVQFELVADDRELTEGAIEQFERMEAAKNKPK